MIGDDGCAHLRARRRTPAGALRIGAPARGLQRMQHTVQRGREVFDGRVVWNVNSTARGGGVAEMLVSLLAYARGAGIDARWVVIEGNEDFFVLTKRIHNFLHGSSGDGGDLDDDARRVFDEVTERNAVEFRELIKPEDVVIVHDPQPAGLIPRDPRDRLPDGVALSRRRRPARRARASGRGSSSSPTSATRTPMSSRARPSRGRGSTRRSRSSRPRSTPSRPRTRSSTASACCRSSASPGSTRTARPAPRPSRAWTGARAASTARRSAGSGARCARPTGSWSRSRAGTRSRTRSG